MKQAADNDELLIQYLLGELSEDEQEGIEQRYLSDPEFYEHLLTVEDDLIDAYAEGALSQSRRASFESHFLRSPERQARVGFAKAWVAYVSRQSKSARSTPVRVRRPFFGLFSFESWPAAVRVMAVLLVVVGGAFLIAETVRLRNRFGQAESERAALEKTQQDLQQQLDEERRRSQDLSSQLERDREAREPQVTNPEQVLQSLVSLILTPGLVRGSGDAKRLIIPPQARQVRLQVSSVRGDYDSYGVAIRTVEGKPIWSKTGLKAQSRGENKVVIVLAPADVFANEDYILKLTGESSVGREDLNEYFFGVSRISRK